MLKFLLWRQNISRQAPILFTDAGRWWGNHPAKRAECEIDVIADNNTDAIFAECKWTNVPIGLDALRTLMDRSELFHYANMYYYLFAKTGFTEALKSEASHLGNVYLVPFDNF